jgi:hypothetical protein
MWPGMIASGGVLGSRVACAKDIGATKKNAARGEERVAAWSFELESLLLQFTQRFSA